jgi:FkbM family methyltransferase
MSQRALGWDVLEPLSGVLTESVESVKQREASALDDLLRARQNRCVIFGAGTLGRKALSLFREIGVEPLAICDSNPNLWGTTIAETIVLSPSEAAAQFGTNAVFFVTIWNDFHWFRATRAKLTALGCTLVSSYAPIFWRFGDRFMHLLLLNEPAHRLYQDLDRVLEAESLWTEAESLSIYRSNILWRALGDPSHLPWPAPQNTYFPPDLFRLTSKESIVDIGAFDGDTIRLILNLAGSDFERIHAIEADSVSAGKLDAYISSLPETTAKKIRQLNCAVSAERCVLRFSASGNATSKIEDDGVDVQCFPLDELFQEEPVTFIKMDIEGAEYDALLGAAKTIEQNLPVLAICVYHTQNDIWRIPLLIRSRYPTYQLYLRTYDGDGFQTVLYAVPPDRVLSEAAKSAAPRLLKPVD